jgi:GTP cyclohydrolase FolE2
MNPKFVEDIIRDAVVNLNSQWLNFDYIEVENFESIHTHNAFAEIFNNS